ncbi:hypothetical protein [Actinophytocola sp. NPDC049390]|uniref:hypothetical protein n=1 Tax=Actinophytocola sp. NPDC049390 TaxID=3363894 RepID=UPI0037A046DD
MAFAGQRLTANVLGVAESSAETASGSTTSTTYTATLTGGTACGVAFVAPASGTVLVHNSSFVDNSTSGRSYMTFRIRTGGTIGSGTDVVAAVDDNAVSVLGADDASFGRAVMVEGLTAGATYNCQQLFKASAGTTATFQWKKLVVQPVP